MLPYRGSLRTLRVLGGLGSFGGLGLGREENSALEGHFPGQHRFEVSESHLPGLQGASVNRSE